jgi:hypothetical protein
MAAATRLMEPLRTSPAANTPGLLVSRKNGVRFSCSSWTAGIAASQEEAVLVLSAELPLPTIATGPLRQAWASAYVAA